MSSNRSTSTGARACGTGPAALLAAALGLAAVGSASAAPVADLGADFSNAVNPAGAWTYGSSDSLGGAFVAFTTLGALASQVPVWSGAGLYPFVAKNEGPGNYIGSTAVYAPGDVAFHPGAGGEFALARYVVPTGGLFQLDAEFARLDAVYPTTSSVHIVVNGVSIFDGELDAGTAQLGFAQTLSLTGGDRIDFAVGYGSNSNYFGDTTGVVATLAAVGNQVAEPGTLALMLCGGLLLGHRRRRG